MAEPLSDPDAAELPARDEVIREIAMLSARCCCPRRRREGEYGLNVSEGRVSAGVAGVVAAPGERASTKAELGDEGDTINARAPPAVRATTGVSWV